MDVSLRYAEEIFFEAVRVLAAGGTLKSRLVPAAHYLIRLRENHFPDEEHLRGKFLEVLRKLTEVRPESAEGSIQASVFAMSEEEESQVSEKIVSIYAYLARRDPGNLYHP